MREYIENQIVVYEAHNVESTMKREKFPKTTYEEELVRQIYDFEKNCCVKANFTLAYSKESQKTFLEFTVLI